GPVSISPGCRGTGSRPLMRISTSASGASGCLSVRNCGRGNVTTRRSPICLTEACSTRSGALLNGGSGGPFLPPPPAASRTGASSSPATAIVRTGRALTRIRSSEDVPAEILIRDDIGQSAVHVRRVDDLAPARQVRPLEQDLVEDFLQDGVEAARSDVLRPLV